MSFSERIGAAIAAVRSFVEVERLNREIAAAWGARILGDDAAQAATEALEGRKRALREPQPALPLDLPAGSKWPPKRRPRSRDRERSKGRRRRLAASGMLPPDLAEAFTPGQIAVLSIIAQLCAEHGQCALCVDAIAARAGVCARMVQTAQRLAESFGWLVIEARPRPGRKNLPNVLRIVSKKWLAWLGVASRHRVQNSATPGNSQISFNLTASGISTHSARRAAAARSFGSPKGGGEQVPPKSASHARLDAALARSETFLASERR